MLSTLNLGSFCRDAAAVCIEQLKTRKELFSHSSAAVIRADQESALLFANIYKERLETATFDLIASLSVIVWNDKSGNGLRSIQLRGASKCHYSSLLEMRRKVLYLTMINVDIKLYRNLAS